MALKRSLNGNARFWLLLLLQVVGAQMILWNGLPVYHRLHAVVPQGAYPGELAIAVCAIAIMQTAHWLAVPLRRDLQLRRNPVLGYCLATIGDSSQFFVSALSAYILFDFTGDVAATLGKVMVLLAILYATNCFRHLVGSVADEMINAEP
jgi:hypothetical protein